MSALDDTDPVIYPCARCKGTGGEGDLYCRDCQGDGFDCFDRSPLFVLAHNLAAAGALCQSFVLGDVAATSGDTAFKRTPFKLACSATPAPNDHMELGQHAEFLDVLTSHEMLARWFINDQSEFGTYRLKGHAARDFWDWTCSWARYVGTPADLGYSVGGILVDHARVCDGGRQAEGRAG